MKKLFAVICSVFFALLFFSCSNMSESSKSSISVVLPQKNDRAVFSKEDAKAYSLQLLTDSDNLISELNDISDSVAKFNDVAEGSYKVKVFARNEKKKNIAVGESEVFEVIADKEATVSVKMKPFEYFTITYELDGGTLGDAVRIFTEEDKIDLGIGAPAIPLPGSEYKDTIYYPAPTKEGFVFGGWYTSPNFSQQGYCFSGSRDITFYAKWLATSYTGTVEGLASVEFGDTSSVDSPYSITITNANYSESLDEDVNIGTLSTTLNSKNIFYDLKLQGSGCIYFNSSILYLSKVVSITMLTPAGQWISCDMVKTGGAYFNNLRAVYLGADGYYEIHEGYYDDILGMRNSISANFNVIDIMQGQSEGCYLYYHNY